MGTICGACNSKQGYSLALWARSIPRLRRLITAFAKGREWQLSPFKKKTKGKYAKCCKRRTNSEQRLQSWADISVFKGWVRQYAASLCPVFLHVVFVHPPDVPEHNSSQKCSCLSCPRLLWTILKPSVSYKPSALFPPISFKHKVAGLAHLPGSPQLLKLYPLIIIYPPGKALVNSMRSELMQNVSSRPTLSLLLSCE